MGTRKGAIAESERLAEYWTEGQNRWASGPCSRKRKWNIGAQMWPGEQERGGRGNQFSINITMADRVLRLVDPF